jgi:hypothetical protein
MTRRSTTLDNNSEWPRALLVEAAVGSRFNVNPILLGVSHSPTAGHLAWRSGFVERTGTRTVTEGLGSVAALTRIPLINNHLDRHLTSPNAAGALFLVGSCCKSPMTAFPVNRKRWWITWRSARLFMDRSALAREAFAPTNIIQPLPVTSRARSVFVL